MENFLEENRVERVFRINNKIIIEGGVYHITQRAPGREKLFVEERDYLYFLHLFKEVSSKYILDIYSFVLMPNHLHILLKINEKNLSQAMKLLYQRYALYFNLKYQRKGHVFSGTYRTSLCNSDRYMLAISAYIHLNPVKAGIVEKAGDYRWSSIKLYLEENKSKFVKPDFILDLLSGDKDKAKEYYKNLIKAGCKFKYKNCFKDKRWLISFMEGFRKKLSQFPAIKSKEIREFLDLEKRIDSIKDVKRIRDPQKAEAKKYLIQQLLSCNYSIEDIANRLGITRQTVYRFLKENP
ncbi:MAG: transposase [Candidatus Omnitrophota bacterium]